MKRNKLKTLFPAVIILLSFILAIYFYPFLPDTIATHWGLYGEANGYSSKLFGLSFMPILSIFLFALFLFLPKTDPYKANFTQFKGYFENFINIVFLFLFYLYILTIVWNLGYHFNMVQYLSPAFAFIFYFAGVLTQNTKRNWFVGIRTPWTLSNEKVWEKTHVLGGKLFKVVALISLLGIVLPNLAMFLILIPVLTVSVFIFIYSYIEYRKINNH